MPRRLRRGTLRPSAPAHAFARPAARAAASADAAPAGAAAHGVSAEVPRECEERREEGEDRGGDGEGYTLHCQDQTLQAGAMWANKGRLEKAGWSRVGPALKWGSWWP